MACYTPAVPSGVPCSPHSDCPVDQTCVAGLCFVAGETPPDQDGDGRPDHADNCPTVINIDQGNEDGDGLGDVCDPCPYVAQTALVDGDGDGIADACDPYPTRKDKVWLFAGLHDGPPAWPGTDRWTAVGDADQVRIAAVGSGPDGEYRTLPLSSSGRMYNDFTAVVGFTVDQPVGSDTPAVGFSVHDGNLDRSLDCDVYQNGGNVNDHHLVLEDHLMSNDQPFPWQAGMPYTLTLVVQGGKFTCRVAGASEQQMVTSMSPITAQDGGALDLFAYDVTTKIDWVYVVGQ